MSWTRPLKMGMRLIVDVLKYKFRYRFCMFCLAMLFMCCSLFFIGINCDWSFVRHQQLRHERHILGKSTSIPPRVDVGSSRQPRSHSDNFSHTKQEGRTQDKQTPPGGKSDQNFHVVPSGFVVDTPGCRIPAMDPFDPLIKKFIEKVTPIDCAANSSPQLVKSNLTSLYVDHAALAYYNVSDTDQLECCYRPFWRVDGDMSNYSSSVDNKIQYATNCTSFKNEALLYTEFVKVECQIDDTEIYTDYHSFTPLNEDRVKREDEQTMTDDSLSILVIGIDAVSRLNFHRQMPLTEAFLREMGAIEMLGYNKVADNTFPNLIPVLSGLTEEELVKTCWKSNNVSFDLCPLLWKNYSAAGYTTAFGEDAPWMGIFSYFKVGFVHQPTDYYMRPYSKTYEDNAGHTKRMNAKLCIGPRLTLEILLQYASKFAQTFAKKRSLGFFWGGSLSHDYLNYPQLGDHLHESVFRQLVVLGALNRTLLIVMSDHGIRWGPIRKTYQGRLEERLPLLFFMFPAWFRDKYSGAFANLHRNAHRLTTPFDLHVTLLDLLKPSGLQKESLQNRIQNEDFDSPTRGVSLFLPVSKNRTCAEAGILAHWCTCHQSQPLLPESAIAKYMALVLVKHVNDLLKPYRACALLKLLTVHDARVQFPLEHLSHDTKSDILKDYVLVVQTTPGNALFEATVRQSAPNRINVEGTVSRINTYGNQSSCVSDFHMKLYCYCDIFHRFKL